MTVSVTAVASRFLLVYASQVMTSKGPIRDIFWIFSCFSSVSFVSHAYKRIPERMGGGE